ncbi:MAG: YggS family pyridoxal phosphate-dependent enzyme [Clostridiales bacterium]|nr:YggS family pyridoxal phosphate-dependent enzyme [Clostridiales bacterium]
MYDYNEELYRSLSERLSIVRENIADACREAGRDPSKVTLIGVSKVFPVSYAEAACAAGLADLGENRVQEIVPKIERFNELGLSVNWHLIGTLQKNKVKYIIGKTHLIHSVDSAELASEIGKRSAAAGLTTDILLQVNVSGELSKHGFSVETFERDIDIVNSIEGINIRGMMTMAPIQSVPGEASKVFYDTRKLYEKIRPLTKSPSDFNILSMGMSQDYRYAIAEGSTCVRIGTSIFGDRNALKA